MKKEKHSDISSRKKSNQKIIDSYDYLSNAASAQDCTGLIPVGPTNRAELELIRRNVSDFYQPNKERFRSFCPKPFLIFMLVTTTIT